MSDFVHVDFTIHDKELLDLEQTSTQVEEHPESDIRFLGTHSFVRQTVLDKIYGCFIGSALGDTIGLYTEFLPKSACETIYKSRKFSLVPPVTEYYPDSHRRK
jgi:hypothetical protein